MRQPQGKLSIDLLLACGVCALVLYLLFGEALWRYNPELPWAEPAEAVPVAEEGNEILAAIVAFKETTGQWPLSLAEAGVDAPTQHRWEYEPRFTAYGTLHLFGTVEGRSGSLEPYATRGWHLHTAPYGRDNQQNIPLGVPVPAGARKR